MTPELEKLAKSLEWQPIETAVRSGPLLVRDNESACFAEWNFIHECWEPYNCYASDSECSVSISFAPTHYISLPTGNAGEVIRVLVEAIDGFISARNANLAAFAEVMGGESVSMPVHPAQHKTLPEEFSAIEGLNQALARAEQLAKEAV